MTMRGCVRHAGRRTGTTGDRCPPRAPGRHSVAHSAPRIGQASDSESELVNETTTGYPGRYSRCLVPKTNDRSGSPIPSPPNPASYRRYVILALHRSHWTDLCKGIGSRTWLYGAAMVSIG